MSNTAKIYPRNVDRPALLSVVCPAFNEALSLVSFHDALTSVLNDLGQPYEIVFVNDGSSDATLDVMRTLRMGNRAIAIVDLSRNFGKEIAITAGLDHASGDAAIIMDTDLQHPPSLIEAFIEGWREGNEIVYAQRQNRAEERWLKRSAAKAFYRIMNKSGEAPLPENAGDFRLLSRKAIDAVLELREHHRFMKGVYAWVGFPSKAIPFEASARIAGQTSWNYWKLWNFSIEGVTAHTLLPLKISTYLGIVVALVSFIYGFFIIAKTLAFGDSVPGFPTLATLVLFLGGIQLIVLGVIGEYLGRVFNETKNRPLYFVSSILPADSATSSADDQIACE